MNGIIIDGIWPPGIANDVRITACDVYGTNAVVQSSVVFCKTYLTLHGDKACRDRLRQAPAATH